MVISLQYKSILNYSYDASKANKNRWLRLYNLTFVFSYKQINKLKRPTLLENFWWILLHMTDDAIAKLHERKVLLNREKWSKILSHRAKHSPVTSWTCLGEIIFKYLNFLQGW